MASYLVHLIIALVCTGVYCMEEERPPTYLSGDVGSSVLFSCVLDFPGDVPVPYLLYWNKGGRTVGLVGLEGKLENLDAALEGRVILVEASFSRVDINLTSLSQADTGWYECRLVIPNRTPSTRLNGTWFQLTVHGVDLLDKAPTNQTVMDGETAKFECVTKLPGARVTWFKDGIPLKEIQGLASRATVSSEGSLTIGPTDITDPGLYRCQIVGPGGESQSAIAYLDVQYKARVVFSPREVYLPPGREAIIDCHISANPPLTKLRWEKDGLLFDHFNVKEVYLKKNGSAVSLFFSKIDEAHAGKYTCTPYNVLGSAGPSLPILVVVQHPPSFTLTPHNLYLRKVGDTVHMVCDALDGERRPTITWFKKDRSPLPLERTTFDNGNMTIHNLKEEDRGMYECVASNEAATISTYTELVIENSAPRGPHELTGNATHDSVSLSWRPGYGAKTHRYSIWVRGGSNTEWRSVSVKGPHATISSLQPGTTYEFMVLSQDHTGEGMISRPITITTLGEAEADSEVNDAKTAGELAHSSQINHSFEEVGRPRNLRMSGDSLLEWDAPEFGSDLVSYYMVLWDTQPGASLRTIAQTSHTYHTVDTLEEEVTNYLQVRAVTVNNHYSSSDIFHLYVPAQRSAAVSLFIATLIGAMIALVILCIFMNRVRIRTRFQTIKTEGN